MLFFQVYIVITALAAVGLIASILNTLVARVQGATEEQWRWALWVEVVTAQPNCTYYFGPFLSTRKAKILQAGYVEDLEGEGANGITARIKWCKPRELTICKNELAEVG